MTADKDLNTKNIRDIAIEVVGMHCVACELWIESNLLKITGIELVNSKFNANTIKISYDENQIKESELVTKVQKIITEKGYSIKTKNDDPSFNISNWINIFLAFMIAVLLAWLYSTFLGEVSLDTNKFGTGFFTYLLIGLVASISNCGMTVGSMLIGWLTNKEKTDKISTIDTLKYLSIFNISRVLFYIVFGGVLGYLGSFFLVNSSVYFWIQIISAIVIAILAFSLLDIFTFFEKFVPRLPSNIILKIFDLQNKDGYFSLILIALFSFFLPCGFTLAVQTEALKSGNFLQGGLIMGAFVIGTIPIISLLGYFSNAISNSKYAQIFFKIVGFLMLFYVISLLLEIFKF